jgi:hypothetical protein
MTSKLRHPTVPTGSPAPYQSVAATERDVVSSASPDQFQFVADWQMLQPVADDTPVLLVVGHGHLVQTAIRPVLQELPASIADCLYLGDHRSVPV